MKEIVKKLFIAATFVFISICANAQSSWTEEEVNVLNEFGLDSTDHRGIIIKHNISCDKTLVISIKEFFYSSEKLDVTTIYVSSKYENQVFLNQILDMHQLIQLYLTESK